jgi:hypothetical protein
MGEVFELGGESVYGRSVDMSEGRGIEARGC